MDQLKIGKFIADCRKNKKMTQMQLAEHLGITDKAVSKWEHGVALPDIMTLYSMCRLFGVTMEQLITNDISDRLQAIV